MTRREDLRGLVFYPANLMAAMIVLGAMALLYWKFSGPDVPDWIGYSDLFDFEGGWLVRQGRDPLFVGLLQAARKLFGVNGYVTFRFILFTGFALLAARFAYAMPNRRVWPILSAALILAALLLKSLVQIRECLAFLLVALPLISVFRHGRGGWIAAGVMALAGAFMHAGATLFLVAWLAASALALASPRILRARQLAAVLLVLGVGLGAAITAVVFRYSQTLDFALQDLGADTTAKAIGGFWKYAYWVAIGFLTLIARHQLLDAARGSRKFGYSYSIIIGSFILPLTYTVCLFLIFSRFYLPSLTTLSIRFLFSSMQLGLIVIGLRDKANLWTFNIASVLLLDAFRLLISPTALTGL